MGNRNVTHTDLSRLPQSVNTLGKCLQQKTLVYFLCLLAY